MIAWLTDTFIYTGVLIAAVLLLRRPVTRHFGAQTAYMLWALPFLRLLLPPLVLPASLAPATGTASTVPAGDIVAMAASPAMVAPAAASFDYSAVAMLIWLGGAVVFLAWRIATYRQMRRAVLIDARPVGEVGRVRLLECPDVAAPVAFGVADKVVALPLLFMAQPDRQGRDLAIAHELAHHRGHDLLANFAAQALLALHWFNPLAWYGWRAMRRDQEAACDARVLSGRCREDRVRYAALIASIAAGPEALEFRALAAPMACPVLGEASIIHRLKSLPMTETSTRRRWAGRTMVASCALALPLTASISYAAEEQSAVSTATTHSITVHRSESSGRPDGEVFTRVISRDDGTTIVLKTDREISEAEAAQEIAELERITPVPRVPPIPPVPPVAGAPAEVRQFVTRRATTERSEAQEERAAARRESEIARLEAQAERGEGNQSHRIVIRQTDDEGGEANVTTECEGSGNAAVICEARVRASSLTALKSARAAIATASIPETARAEALRELDQEIARMSRGG